MVEGCLCLLAMEKHTDDLRNVNEGDSVEITTTSGSVLRATCESKTRQHADPRSGEVRETRIWTFAADDEEIAATITDGLRSSADDPEFPQHSALWNIDREENMGYAENIRIFGSA